MIVRSGSLTTFLALTFAVLLFSAGEAWSLPKYPGSYTSNTWTNCVGTFTFANGDKYVGEFKDGERYGQGTSTEAAGLNVVMNLCPKIELFRPFWKSRLNQVI